MINPRIKHPVIWLLNPHLNITFTQMERVFQIGCRKQLNLSCLTHLDLLASGEHEFSDEADGCRFSAHMDLLSTQTWSCEKTWNNIQELNGMHFKNKMQKIQMPHTRYIPAAVYPAQHCTYPAELWSRPILWKDLWSFESHRWPLLHLNTKSKVSYTS